MAQATQNKKKTDTAPKNTKKKSAAAPPPEPDEFDVLRRRLVRRRIAALIFAALGVLTLIGCFPGAGSVVIAVCDVLKGLCGWGFWLCAPAFILSAVVLGFGDGKRAAWRTVSAMLAPIFIAALAHMLFSKAVLPAAGIAKTLFSDGKAMFGGGLLGGGLAYLSVKALGAWGSGTIFFLLFVLFSMSACGVTLKKLFGAAKRSGAEKPVSSERVAEKKAAAPEKHEKSEKPTIPEKTEKAEKPKKRSIIDVPLDDFDTSKDDPELFASKREKEPEEPKPAVKRRVKPEQKKPASNTDNTKPLSIEEAAEIAGITAPLTLTGSGTTAAVGISDPPRITRNEVEAETEKIARSIESSGSDGGYERPPIFLLKKGHATASDTEAELLSNRDRLESTIKSFGVNASIVSTTHGPTVTRYDLELEQGVKLSRLTNLANDIALALGVVSVRIAPIPNKISTVGIEVPNKLISTVYLRDIVDSPKFASSKSNLSFAIGKDIGGEPVVGNISKLPHLLIAGTTGSGKSVCMNSLIISLLYKSDPEDVKLIMIDPKMVELGVYNGIPHLYIPVVTDPKKAAGALQWAVTEMLKRYRLFSEVGVRSLSSYNDYLIENGQQKIPAVVVVIDELADLMLVASKEVEESICRVAQMGRAAGMHLVIATQRPSADVITGLMKANIPSRIAFAVSSSLESRIILDTTGAEKLIGMGDMLYAPLGCGKPLRVQGAFVSDEERDQIVSFIKEQGTASYSEEITAQIEKHAEEKNSKGKSSEPEDSGDPAGEYDELLPQAVDVAFDMKQISVSMLQRRLKLGYSRAARIVDQMEELGIVGPFEGSKPRQMIISREQWLEMQYSHGTAPTEILKVQTDFEAED